MISYAMRSLRRQDEVFQIQDEKIQLVDWPDPLYPCIMAARPKL